MDAFTRLVSYCVKVAQTLQPQHSPNESPPDSARSSKNEAKIGSPTDVVKRALAVIARAIQSEGDVRGTSFNQRPFFRILSNLLSDFSVPSFEDIRFGALTAMTATLHVTNPNRLPNFCFSWLELISHKHFLPAVLGVGTIFVGDWHFVSAVCWG